MEIKIEETIDFDQIFQFFMANKSAYFEIPFYTEEIILPTKNKYNWNKNSIKSFFTQNLVIFVKSSKVVKKEPVIGLFLRKDLKLGKGKKGAQLSHAAVTLLFQPQIKSPTITWDSSKDGVKIWYVQGLKELMEIRKICIKEHINSALINDAGHTQVEPGTSTCIGVGPLQKVWCEILAESVDAIEVV